MYEELKDKIASGIEFYPPIGDMTGRIFDKSSESNNITSLDDNTIVSDTPIKSVFKFNEYNRNYFIMPLVDAVKNREGVRFICDYIVSNTDGEPIKHSYEYDIYLPYLKVNEKFCLEDIDTIVTIKDIMRTSNNKIIYICENQITISDEAHAKRIELQKECDKINEGQIKQYKQEQCENANPTKIREDYISKEPKKKKGFFARLFSRK
jgi:hypothetical protein